MRYWELKDYAVILYSGYFSPSEAEKIDFYFIRPN